MAAASLMPAFELDPRLEATEPPEARGLRRDEVRLLVSDIERDTIAHARFSDLPRWLAAGDVLVVNTSGTLNASLPATTSGERFDLHLSTRLPGGFWTLEVRVPSDDGSMAFPHARAGTTFDLPAGGRAALLAPYPLAEDADRPTRLWLSALTIPAPLVPYLERYGAPIRYRYVRRPWPPSMYQTVFALDPGSAEMPSAGRPFTPELVTRLVARGIQFAPLLLHAGVASPEDHEPPYEEFYRVPRDTSERVNAARRAGRRIIAVGTTVVRALETVTDVSGDTFPGEGWTDLVIAPGRPVRSVTGIITGLHEPRATHLLMLREIVRDRRHLNRAYDEARRSGYLWHEFGDSHLILSRQSSVVSVSPQS